MATVEIITIGDELVEGRLVDSNSGYLSGRLHEAGLQVVRHVSVGDDMERIITAFREAGARADAVLVSGGLGPTTDDLTAEAAAAAFNQRVVLFPEALEHTRAMFARMNRVMSPNNEKQAWLPEHCTVLPNARGTACGFHMQGDRARFYFMPGVPHELKGLFELLILPELRTRLQAETVRVGALHTFGLGESKVGSLLEDLRAEAPGSLLIQYRAAMPEVHVRLCLRGYGPDDAAGDVALAALVEEAARRLGPSVFSLQQESLPRTLVRLLIERGDTVSTAESCTGGGVAAAITSVSGASATLMGGVVAYANAQKEQLLGVPGALIEAHGAVSEPVARAMAEGVRERLGTTWGISTTGIAGPTGGSDEKPVGTVFIAVAGPNGTVSRRIFFPGERERVRTLAVASAQDLLRRQLLGIEVQS